MENYVRKMFLKKPLPTHSYLHQLPAVRFLKEHGGLDFPSSLTFLVGENGTGINF